jgi:hypothetical protein
MCFSLEPFYFIVSMDHPTPADPHDKYDLDEI